MARISRRSFQQTLLAASTLAAAPWAMSRSALAQGASFDEGIDYLALPKAQTPAQARQAHRANGPVEVAEFFWFACPYCWRLEPRLQEWKSQLDPSKVSFKQVHVGFAPDGQQRLFASLQALKRTDLAGPIFDSIHIQKKAIRSDADAQALLAALSGLTAEAVKEAWNSPAVNATVEASNAQVAALGVKSVPSFVVDGRFLATPQLASGNNARLIQIVNYLVARSRAA